MKKKDQQRFICELCDSVKSTALKAKLPEDWDGIELRWLLAVLFERAAPVGTQYRKRLRQFKDYITTTPL